jgi:hypothetical protein
MVGRETEGIAQMTEGLAAFRSTGTVARLPLWLIRLAEAYGKARRPLEGLEHLTEAIRIIERTEEGEFEAELYRVRGELLLATEDAGQAEESLHRTRNRPAPERQALGIAGRDQPCPAVAHPGQVR